MMGSVEKSASDLAYRWTRERILDATFGPSDIISEREIAEGVGLSRTPVREAFLRLEGEGFLRLYPKRGAVVVAVTGSDIRDMLQARLVIEPWAASQAAQRDDRLALADRLSYHVDTLVGARQNHDGAGYQEADRAFHLAIVEACDNRLLTDFYRSLRDRQLRVGAVALATSEGRAAAIVKEHRAIANAITAGRPADAADAAGAHVRSTTLAVRPGIDP